MRVVAAQGFSESEDVRPRTGAPLLRLHPLQGCAQQDRPRDPRAAEVGRAPARRIDAAARQCSSPSAQARTYFREGADGLRELSSAFRRDVEHFEATRRAYREIVSDRFIERFSTLLDEAAKAGEIRPINVRFAVGMFRYIAFAVRDEDLLAAAGLTAREAMLEVDKIDMGRCPAATPPSWRAGRVHVIGGRDRTPKQPGARPDSGARPWRHAPRTRPISRCSRLAFASAAEPTAAAPRHCGVPHRRRPRGRGGSVRGRRRRQDPGDSVRGPHRPRGPEG